MLLRKVYNFNCYQVVKCANKLNILKKYNNLCYLNFNRAPMTTEGPVTPSFDGYALRGAVGSAFTSGVY